jgi:hypothetical protein
LIEIRKWKIIGELKTSIVREFHAVIETGLLAVSILHLLHLDDGAQDPATEVGISSTPTLIDHPSAVPTETRITNPNDDSLHHPTEPFHPGLRILNDLEHLRTVCRGLAIILPSDLSSGVVLRVHHLREVIVGLQTPEDEARAESATRLVTDFLQSTEHSLHADLRQLGILDQTLETSDLTLTHTFQAIDDEKLPLLPRGGESSALGLLLAVGNSLIGVSQRRGHPPNAIYLRILLK